MPFIGLIALLKYVSRSVIVHWSWDTRFVGGGTCAVRLLGCGLTAELSYRPTVKLSNSHIIMPRHTHAHVRTDTQNCIHSQLTDRQLTCLSKPLQRKLMSSAFYFIFLQLIHFHCVWLTQSVAHGICMWNLKTVQYLFFYSAELSEYLSICS